MRSNGSLKFTGDQSVLHTIQCAPFSLAHAMANGLYTSRQKFKTFWLLLVAQQCVYYGDGIVARYATRTTNPVQVTALSNGMYVRLDPFDGRITGHPAFPPGDPCR